MEVIKILRHERPLEQEDDLVLLDLMSQKDSNISMAEMAFNEFLRRYGNYLWKICSKACKQFSKGEALPKTFT